MLGQPAVAGVGMITKVVGGHPVILVIAKSGDGARKPGPRRGLPENGGNRVQGRGDGE